MSYPQNEQFRENMHEARQERKAKVDSWYTPQEKKDKSKGKSIRRHALKQVDKKWKARKVLTPKEMMARKLK